MLGWYPTLHEADIMRYVDGMKQRLADRPTNIERLLAVRDFHRLDFSGGIGAFKRKSDLLACRQFASGKPLAIPASAAVIVISAILPVPCVRQRYLIPCASVRREESVCDLGRVFLKNPTVVDLCLMFVILSAVC